MYDVKRTIRQKLKRYFPSTSIVLEKRRVPQRFVKHAEYVADRKFPVRPEVYVYYPIKKVKPRKNIVGYGAVSYEMYDTGKRQTPAHLVVVMPKASYDAKDKTVRDSNLAHELTEVLYANQRNVGYDEAHYKGGVVAEKMINREYGVTQKEVYDKITEQFNKAYTNQSQSYNDTKHHDRKDFDFFIFYKKQKLF